MMLMVLTIFGETTCVFGPDSRPMSTQDLLNVIDYSAAEKAFCPAGMLERCGSSEHDLVELGKLSDLMYGGCM